MTTTAPGSLLVQPPVAVKRTRRARARTSLLAGGEPMVWLTGGSLVLCCFMIIGLLGLVIYFGMSTFWPLSVVEFTTKTGGIYMGEVSRTEPFKLEPGALDALPADMQANIKANHGFAERSLVRTGNFRITQSHFNWVSNFDVAKTEEPRWAVVVEQMEWGRFYGFPNAFVKSTPLSLKAADGKLKTADELRADAKKMLQTFKPTAGAEVQLLVSKLNKQSLAAVTDIDKAGKIVGIAEVFKGAEAAWAQYNAYHDDARARWQQRRRIEKHDIGEVNARQEAARLALRSADLEAQDATAKYGESSPQHKAAMDRLLAQQKTVEEVTGQATVEFDKLRADITKINDENARYQLVMLTAGDGKNPPAEDWLRLDNIVRAYPANQLTLPGKIGVYIARWWEFLTDEPREANSEGGIFPAIFGTVCMTMVMTLLVVPFGTLASLYLREYAKAGPIVSAVRIAVNNLAGVPSIVFGVFGLGFFCYVVGAQIDSIFYRASLPNPTFGKGGLMWAAFTLALLTLPVVIVATEEALAAVPNSMREGSYACGASKWQTIRRIVLPRAMPGIMTGMILAMARGAGEVAPLMLVGAVKLAPELPIDGAFPYIHAQRSFMHLGFHIYDVGFQSQNSEAAKPMVFTTTLLLIAIVAVLNIAAIWIRSRLKRRFVASQF